MARSDPGITTRRAFLTKSALALGSVAALPVLQACGGSGSGASGNGSLDFEGWNYDPAFQTDVVNEFVQKNPAIQAKFVGQPADQYLQKMIARFTSGNPADVLYVRDQGLAGWADAGYLQPIEGFAGWEELTKGLIPFHRNAMEHQGKVWGLPYYGDHIAYVYNKAMLQKVGVSAPPATWAEVAEQALAIKRAGILDKPVVFPLKAGGGLHWWSAVYASGGSLFDESGDPVFPDKDPVALGLLEWIVDAARNKQILDPASVQMGTAETRLAIAAGQVAFASSARYDLKMINDPKTSKIAGSGAQTLFPSLTASGPHATVGWTQMFSIAAKTKHAEQAWTLLKYISSPEVAKRYYLKNGVGYAYQALDQDPDISAETAKWSDQEMFARQSSLAKARESLALSWATEWEDYNLQQMQEAVLGKKSPREALTDSADKARQLKKTG
jgi:multiple sugar transport system substrate-binding protein